MPAQENKAIFLRSIEELMRGNIGIVDEVCSPNFRQDLVTVTGEARRPLYRNMTAPTT
jgi:hypothetical protein